jgi:hypothetical protein
MFVLHKVALPSTEGDIWTLYVHSYNVATLKVSQAGLVSVQVTMMHPNLQSYHIVVSHTKCFDVQGAVGVKLQIYRRTMCFLTCHLAAHMEHVSRRNADFDHIYNQLSFGKPSSTAVNNVAAGGFVRNGLLVFC